MQLRLVKANLVGKHYISTTKPESTEIEKPNFSVPFFSVSFLSDKWPNLSIVLPKVTHIMNKECLESRTENKNPFLEVQLWVIC